VYREILAHKEMTDILVAMEYKELRVPKAFLFLDIKVLRVLMETQEYKEIPARRAIKVGMD
jgi:hypothetical protein